MVKPFRDGWHMSQTYKGEPVDNRQFK
jgi:hypothetical protein